MFSFLEIDLVVGFLVFFLEIFVLLSIDLYILLVGNLLVVEDCVVGGCGVYVFLGEGVVRIGGVGGGFIDCWGGLGSVFILGGLVGGVLVVGFGGCYFGLGFFGLFWKR